MCPNLQHWSHTTSASQQDKLPHTLRLRFSDSDGAVGVHHFPDWASNVHVLACRQAQANQVMALPTQQSTDLHIPT